MRLRSTPEVLKTTPCGPEDEIFLSLGVASRRAFFCLTENFPKPLMSRSSPWARILS